MTPRDRLNLSDEQIAGFRKRRRIRREARFASLRTVHDAA
jgi:hypothetical protein